MSRLDSPKLTLWKIIATIHTFGGSIMLSTITGDRIPNTFLLSFGIFLFLVNFMFIFLSYDFKNKEFRKIKLSSKELGYLELSFFVSMMDMFIFMIILTTPS